MENEIVWWFGINKSDWLNALINFLGVVLAILTAVWLTPRLTERQNRRGSREKVLRMLLNSRLIPEHPDYQGAIALIPLEFSDDLEVNKTLEKYLAIVSEDITKLDVDAKLIIEELASDQRDKLIERLAASLGNSNITAGRLRSLSYISEGFVIRERLQLESFRAWPRIAESLEKSAELNRQLLELQRDQLASRPPKSKTQD